MDWSSITSNLIIPSLVALAGFAWSKLRGEKTDSWSSAIDGLGKQLVHQLVQLGTDDEGSLMLRAQAWVGLNIGRLKLPQSALITSLVDAMIEHAIGDALAELRKLDDTANAQLEQITTDAQKLPAEMSAAAARGKALVKDMASMVEVVPPDPAPSPLTTTLDPAVATPTKAAQP